MGKKISNEVRMFGVLPSQGADPIPVGKIPDLGTQIAKDGVAQAATTVIHTVTTGKTLYLDGITFSCYNETESPESGSLMVTNASDSTQYYLFTGQIPAHDTKLGSGCFPTALEIPAGWKIKLHSAGTDVFSRAFIHGYEM